MGSGPSRLGASLNFAFAMQSTPAPHLVPGALSGVYSVKAVTMEPQRREERREKGEGARARTNHFAVTDLQVTPVGLATLAANKNQHVGRKAVGI